MTKESFLQIIQSTCVYPEGYTPPFLHWYPLSKLKEGIPAVAFDLDRIYDDRRIRKLKSVLKTMDINEVTVVQNQNCNSKPEQVDLLTRLTEKDEDGYNFPWYVESYYFDQSKEWLIYVSHEGTVTFAGKKLARTAMELLPGKYHRSNTGMHEN